MEHVFKGYAIAKIEYGGWGDSHPVVKGALFKIFPTRADAAHWANAGIAANMTKFLFDMVKHGNIQLETIQDMYMAKFDEDKDKSAEDC